MISATDEDGASMSPEAVNKRVIVSSLTIRYELIMNILDLQCFNNDDTNLWEGYEKILNIEQANGDTQEEVKADDENENVDIIYSVDVFR
jgi:hypothetical protein